MKIFSTVMLAIPAMQDLPLVISATLPRLAVAAILGGAIGVERSWKRRPAGIRTNMFICFGSALFTLLSEQIAVSHGVDPTRITAQIITGIGFLGAGAILHERGSVMGLTTAATIFVVAGVGMASGAGFYAAAVFATVLLLIALVLIGWLEVAANLRTLKVVYEVTGDAAEALCEEVNQILETEHKMMTQMQQAQTPTHWRIQFVVEGNHSEQARIRRRLADSKQLKSALMVGSKDGE